MLWKLVLMMLYCAIVFANDIIEEHLDGSRTVWKDDGSKIESLNTEDKP